jgi:hypothetical protein
MVPFTVAGLNYPHRQRIPKVTPTALSFGRRHYHGAHTSIMASRGEEVGFYGDRSFGELRVDPPWHRHHVQYRGRDGSSGGVRSVICSLAWYVDFCDDVDSIAKSKLRWVVVGDVAQFVSYQ